MKYILAVLLFTLSAFAQSSHSVTLTWTASADAAANPTLTYTVYRADSDCSGTPNFVAVTSLGAVSGTNFNDLNLKVGSKECYRITSELNGLESSPSNSASAVILPAAPSTLVAIPK